MRIVSTKFHGLLDYLISLSLLSYPLIWGFESPDYQISAATGFGIGLYSIFTKYEAGLVKKISMHSHMMFDACAGIFLVLSPVVLNFRNESAIFYIVTGTVLLLYTALTDSRTYFRRYVLHPNNYNF